MDFAAINEGGYADHKYECLRPKPEVIDARQKTEDRKLKTEDRRRKTALYSRRFLR